MSETLFEKHADTPPLAPEPEQPPDYWNLYAVESLGAPAGWRWVTLDSSEKVVPDGYAKVEGAVCPSRGKYNLPDWKKRDVATQRVFFIRFDDFKVWQKEYAAARGKCYGCWGSGKEVEGCGISGTRYRTCGKCGGSGKPVS